MDSLPEDFKRPLGAPPVAGPDLQAVIHGFRVAVEVATVAQQETQKKCAELAATIREQETTIDALMEVVTRNDLAMMERFQAIDRLIKDTRRWIGDVAVRVPV